MTTAVALRQPPGATRPSTDGRTDRKLDMGATLKLPGGGFVGKGNHKLGLKIATWSLPALVTCPGRTKVCTERLPSGVIRCYATQGFSGFQQSRYAANLVASRDPAFVDRMVKLLTQMITRCDTVRLHLSGDFFSPEYVLAWVDIASRCPSHVFYCYTRSWRVTNFDKPLRRLAALPNVALWYSTDRASGHPAVIPARVRTAYLAVDDADATGVDPAAVDLIFRDYPSRGTVLTAVGGSPVCPHENGKAAHMTCERCRICIRPAKQADDRKIAGGVGRRISLSLVS